MSNEPEVETNAPEGIKEKHPVFRFDLEYLKKVGIDNVHQEVKEEYQNALVDYLSNVIGDTEEERKWMKDIMVVSCSGLAGSGKDYVLEKYFCKFLNDIGDQRTIHVGWFANHIKERAIAMEGFKYSEVYGDKSKATRDWLQKEGTERGRDIYGGYVWVKTLLVTMRRDYDFSGVRIFLIPDARFIEELLIRLLFRHTFFLKVVAPMRSADKSAREAAKDPEFAVVSAAHRSETSLNEAHPSYYDMVFNNDYGDECDYGTFSNLLIDTLGGNARGSFNELALKARYAKSPLQ